MRSHLLYNQNRQLLYNIILFCHLIGERIGSDSKLSQRQCLMREQQIFPDQTFIFFRIFKIAAAVIRDISIFKCQFQILVANPVIVE